MKVLFDTKNKCFEDWDALSVEQKDELLDAIYEAQHYYLFKTRKILKNPEDSDKEEIRKVLNHVNEKCQSHDIKGIFRGIEETWEDYYYIIETEEGIVYNTMVDNIEFN